MENGIGGLIGQFTQGFNQGPNRYAPPPQPQGNPHTSQTVGVQGGKPPYPPPPMMQTQDKPTHIEVGGLKYNAIDIDRLSLDIVSKGGFDGTKPDMTIWNHYQYNVLDLKAQANETELSNLINWSLLDLGMKDIKIDFHEGNRVTISGKTPAPLIKIPVPFTAEISAELNANNQILLTINDFSAGVPLPGKVKDFMLDLLIQDADEKQQLPPSANALEAFNFADAMVQVGKNQILLDFTKMRTPMNMPVSAIKFTNTGFELTAGHEQVKKK